MQPQQLAWKAALIRAAAKQDRAERKLAQRRQALRQMMVGGPSMQEDFWTTATRAGIAQFIFGFLDNYIMVVAGQQIDNYVQHLPVIGPAIDKMPAKQRAFYVAGLGNTISDVIGVIVADTLVDNVAAAFGLPDEKVPHHRGRVVGGTAGVLIGCLLGMEAGIRGGLPAGIAGAAILTLVSIMGRQKQGSR